MFVHNCVTTELANETAPTPLDSQTSKSSSQILLTDRVFIKKTIFKVRITETEGERDLPSARTFPRGPKWPGKSETEPSSFIQIAHMGSQDTTIYSAALHGPLSRSWIRSGSWNRNWHPCGLLGLCTMASSTMPQCWLSDRFLMFCTKYCSHVIPNEILHLKEIC